MHYRVSKVGIRETLSNSSYFERKNRAWQLMITGETFYQTQPPDSPQDRNRQQVVFALYVFNSKPEKGENYMICNRQVYNLDWLQLRQLIFVQDEWSWAHHLLNDGLYWSNEQLTLLWSTLFLGLLPTQKFVSVKAHQCLYILRKLRVYQIKS